MFEGAPFVYEFGGVPMNWVIFVPDMREKCTIVITKPNRPVMVITY